MLPCCMTLFSNVKQLYHYELAETKLEVIFQRFGLIWPYFMNACCKKTEVYPVGQELEIWAVCALSCIRLFATPLAVACQAPLSMEFSRQECWSKLPFPPPEDLLNSGIKPMFPTLESGFFTNCSTWKGELEKNESFWPCRLVTLNKHFLHDESEWMHRQL